jgi:hypothetical protein
MAEGQYSGGARFAARCLKGGVDPERDEKPEPNRDPRTALALNWESAAKIGAGLLLAIALVTTLPALMRSDKPAPLEPDVGLPQAAPVAPPSHPGPDPAALARRAKAKRLARRRAAEKRRVARRRAQQRRHRAGNPGHDAGAVAPQPVVAASATAPPPPTRESFGIEQP